MTLTEDDMKEFQGFSQELRDLIAKKKVLDEDIEKTGYTEELMRRLTELSAKFENLGTRQEQFGRKHFLLR